ncbi:MAG: type 4a pilus biogenesis protein PilO [Candidatus Dojkabacteria bacterium]|nr:type 4a pilus biogenesis protein PilO [Candidatus Dojkabacteria bacterium]MDQ7020452.1 type 4a pilus biogenesis protein PilO [Candidatus Dojkabacteria bacterium]
MDQIITLEERKKKEASKSKKYAKFFKFYVVPIISVIIFMVSILLIIIPKFNEITTDTTAISSLESERSKASNKLGYVRALRSNQIELQQNLDFLDSIAPSGSTEVIEFSERLSSLADRYSLEIETQRANDLLSASSINQQGSNLADTSVTIQEIPVSFRMSGTFRNIDSFITELSRLDDFVILRDFTLEGIEEEGRSLWTFELTFSKYQFREDSIEATGRYLKISPSSTLDSSILEYIDRKQL